MRGAIEGHGGIVVKTEGDSFFAVFPTAPGAVAAAADAQRALEAEAWPEDVELRVRIGLHTGEASLSAKTYVGLHVHRASSSWRPTIERRIPTDRSSRGNRNRVP